MRVLDSSAFIADHDPAGQLATVPMVREELRDRAGYRFEAMEAGGMQVHPPTEASTTTVRAAAEQTGDSSALSETDTRLVAAAVELDAILVTDDYAMQNVGAELGLTVEPINQAGIDRQVTWRYQCQGCGRTYESEQARCEVCGAETTRKRS